MEDKLFIKKLIEKMIGENPLGDEHPDLIILNKEGLYRVIFDKSFAKGLWGEETMNSSIVNYGEPDEWDRAYPNKRLAEYTRLDSEKIVGPAWRIHLLSMVLVDNPVEYIKNNNPYD